MSSKWKRNTVAATMAVLVCAAAALNWRYSGALPASGEGTEAGTKILGEATLVSGPDGAQDAGKGKEGKTSAPPAAPADETGVYSGSDYFASARLTRQQARDNAISLLEEAAKQPDAAEDAATAASEGIQVLASYTLKEAQIENLVTAKGYADCVAFMGDESVSVVVSTQSGELTAEDVAKITDIAVNETGYAASGIKIMPAN